METPLHSHDINTAKLSEYQLSGVSFYRRYRKIRYLSIREFITVSYF